MKIIEDKKHLTSEDDIESYFEDAGHELLECGQGYCQNKGEFVVKIDENYYDVTILAEVGSARQDRGDRLYWVEDITSVSYVPVDTDTVLDREKAELTQRVVKAEEILADANKNLSDFLIKHQQ